METQREFHSTIQNCFLMGTQIAQNVSFGYSEDDEQVRAESIFYFPKEHPGLCEVKLNGYLICPLEGLTLDTLILASPYFMRISLFKVLKRWFKAWWK